MNEPSAMESPVIPNWLTDQGESISKYVHQLGNSGFALKLITECIAYHYDDVTS